MAQTLTEQFKVMDVDCHVVEPADLWTSRMSKQKWGDAIPHVRWDPKIRVQAEWEGAPIMEGAERWYIGDKRLFGATTAAVSNYKLPLPYFPPRMEDADPGTQDAHERLKVMDKQGIYAEILYPNVAGFGAQNFMHTKDPELMLECLQVYNDWTAEWCSVAPNRLKAAISMPFWDVDLCVMEIQRCAKLGHAGALFGNQMHFMGYPHLSDPHWNPIWEAVQDVDWSVNFHLANGDPTGGRVSLNNGRQTAYVKGSSMGFMNSSHQVADVILSGMVERYPKVKWVSVESGCSWLPYTLESLDWQWKNSGAIQEHPEMKYLPSEYFKQSCYVTFWFETEAAIHTIQQCGADNIMFETDYPHPTSLTVGPHSAAENAREHLERQFRGRLPDADLQKVLQDNAAKIYHIDLS